MQVKFLTINEINGVQQAIFEEFFGFVSEDVIWILLCVELQTEHSASKDIHGKGCSNTADKIRQTHAWYSFRKNCHTLFPK